MNATLLDLSVIRNVYDPVGLGTDHDGQLPVVATARYSPPEYLFRLEEPSAAYWHGLDVYQIGGLLHDLIMRVPLFDDEFKASAENRYRFAWAVATKTPTVHAEDVDADLIVLARRALDKNWRSRGEIRLEDFYDDSRVQRQHAMEWLGLTSPAPSGSTTQPLLNAARVRTVTAAVEESMTATLRGRGVMPTRQVRPGGSDLEQVVTVEWTPLGESYTGGSPITLAVSVKLTTDLAAPAFAISVRMSRTVNDQSRDAHIDLPMISDGAESVENIAASVIGVLADLGQMLVRAPPET